VLDREAELDGYVVNIVEFRQDIDATALLKGCQDDRCQCPHWGYVTKGKITMRYADRDEVYEAGDAFYAPPGHVPIKHEPGSEIVQFSPAGKLRETQAVMFKNMAALKPR
jgi:hypothetical protein